jgi:hypothetical protein
MLGARCSISNRGPVGMRSSATGPARLRMMTSRARRWRVHSALRRSEWFSAIDRRQGAVTESCHRSQDLEGGFAASPCLVEGSVGLGQIYRGTRPADATSLEGSCLQLRHGPQLLQRPKACQSGALHARRSLDAYAIAFATTESKPPPCEP